MSISSGSSRGSNLLGASLGALLQLIARGLEYLLRDETAEIELAHLGREDTQDYSRYSSPIIYISMQSRRSRDAQQ